MLIILKWVEDICFGNFFVFLLFLIYLSHKFIVFLVFPHLLKLTWINEWITFSIKKLLTWTHLSGFSSNLLKLLCDSLLAFKILLNLFQCILLYFFLLLIKWITILSFIYLIIVLHCHFSTHHRGWLPKWVFWLNFSVIWIDCIIHIWCLTLKSAYRLLIQCHIKHFFLNVCLHRIKVISIFMSLCVILIPFIVFRQIKWHFGSWRWWISTKRCSKIDLLLVYHHCILYLLFNFSLHYSSSVALLSWIQNTHCFKIQCANASHKYFFQIFLHNVLISILYWLCSFCLIKFLP